MRGWKDEGKKTDARELAVNTTEKKPVRQYHALC